MDDDRLGNLDAAEWRGLVRRLTVYAAHRCWFRSWRTGNEGLPKGYEPVDLAFEAILKVCAGERKRVAGTAREIERHLRGIVNSLVSNLATSGDHRSRSRERFDEEADMPASVQDPSGGTPFDEIWYWQLENRIRHCVAGDPALERILDLLLDGSRPRQIAAALGVPRRDIYRSIRTIRRRMIAAGLCPIHRHGRR